MPDYSKLVIYKIQHLTKDWLIYIGSTCNFASRKNQHKTASIQMKNAQLLYKIIYEEGGFEEFNMIKICDYPCNTLHDGLKEEDRLIRLNRATMNSKRAFDDSRIHREAKSTRHAIERAERIAKHKIEMVELKAKEDVKKLKRKTAREIRAYAVHQRGYWEELEYQKLKGTCATSEKEKSKS